MPSEQQQALIEAKYAAIAKIDAQLRSGVTRMDENGRSISFNIAALREARLELIAEVGRLTNARPMTRRLLTFTSSKGL